MKFMGEACPIGEIGKTLLADREQGGVPRFVCRPVAARSSERNTSYGFFVGEIGIAGLGEFKEALFDLAKEDLSKVIVDLCAATLSRTAVGALVAFAASMHGRNKRLYIYHPSPQVRALLKDMKLFDFFTFLETEDDVILTLVV